MLSGAGNAGTAALQQVGNIAGQDFLMQEREKLETARIQLQEQYAKERQQAGFTHATGLLATEQGGLDRRLQKSQDFEAGQAQEKRGADITQNRLNQDFESGEKAKERTSTEGIHTKDRALKDKLGTEENRLRGEYYKALGAKSSAAGGRAGSKDVLPKEYMESVSKPLLDNLYKQLELASPDEKVDIQARIDAVINEARGVAGLSAPDAPAAPQVKDRFAPSIKPKVAAGEP